MPAPRVAFCLTLLSLMAGPAAAADHVTVLVEDAAGPWSNADGTGMANDLVKAAYAAVGVDVTLTVVPYARCKALVFNGAAAACFSMSEAPELKGVVNLADKPLFNVYPRFYQRAGKAVKLVDENGFHKGMRLGIVNAYEYPPAVLELARRGVVLEPARSDLVNLKKLAAGRIDVALIMTDELKTEAMMMRQARVSGVTLAFQSEPMGSFIGFSATHAQGPRAQRLFNDGYARITRDGGKRAIENKWRRLCAAGCDS